MRETLKTEHGQNYSMAHAGAWADFRQHVFKHPVLGDTPGKLFLKGPLRLTGMEISMGSIPPKRGTNFTHRHRENEEVYIFVKGRGQMMVDGQVLEVGEGTAVRVGRDGARAWRNTGDEPLHYIVIQAKAETLANGTITDGVVVSPQFIWKD
jgi:mannose-6-phosphate isomerase-like protein (cupin superfamily)